MFPGFQLVYPFRGCCRLSGAFGSEIARDRFYGTGSILSGPSVVRRNNTGLDGHLFVYFVQKFDMFWDVVWDVLGLCVCFHFLDLCKLRCQTPTGCSWWTMLARAPQKAPLLRLVPVANAGVCSFLTCCKSMQKPQVPAQPECFCGLDPTKNQT